MSTTVRSTTARSTTVSYSWLPKRETPSNANWRSALCGVSLHSHTSVSKECVGILFEHGARNPLVAWVLDREKRRYRARFGKELDFGRAYWTSPVTPHEAHTLEAKQIRTALGMHALVSLTDHDDIEANQLLQLIDGKEDIPVSTEWTVPYEDTFFHFGIHNLPKDSADEFHHAMQVFRKDPAPQALHVLLAELHAIPDLLIVLNHPLWDEAGLGQQHHEAALHRLLDFTREYLDALELNGLRTWKENQRVLRLAEQRNLPAVSGGDRHGLEPNALLNVTNAATFSEFVGELRDGHSHVVLMPQYREHRNMRCFQTAWDMIREHPDHPYGQVTCLHRTYFVQESGEHTSIASLFPNGTPSVLEKVLWAVQLLESPKLRPALRMALSDGEGLPS